MANDTVGAETTDDGHPHPSTGDFIRDRHR